MATRRPKGVVAQTANGNITDDMILGYIALVSIPNAPISTTKLRRAWLMHGQDEKLVPKDRKAADVFAQACRSIESRRTHSERTTEIKVDRVLQSEEESVYQVTQMLRDKDQKLIEHPKAMRITYSQRDGKIKDEPIDDRKLYKELKELADQIREHFDKNATKVPGAKVRNAIRETLMAEHATRVQNKGVYFVPKVARRTLDDLQGVLRDLYGDAGHAELAILPLAADKPEKEMVKHHFEDSVTENIDALLAEISQRLKSDQPLRADRQANLVADRKRLNEGIDRYRDMLDDRMIGLSERMKLLDDGLEQLLITGAAD
jgi:hypothetical protein